MTMNDPRIYSDPLGEAAVNAAKEIAHRTWQSLLGIGIASVILGVIVLLWPGATLLVVAILFGIYLLISGIFQIAATFGVQHAHGWWRFLSFVSGAISILLAFVAFRNIESAVILLAIWVGIGWIFRGVTELSVFMDSASGLPGRGWGIFTGVVTVVAGGILIIWPISSIATLTVVSGIMLVVVGIVEVVNAFTLRSQVHRAGEALGTR
ncbi:MAG: HdeD family acid-resistance protein [Gordonia sp. (in: high G+C Gram-positive bacteria)]|uniref:HdeD family acid-resistance protein n=1 Tax=Gordonia TaxID=2053 RepID=UPI003266A45F